MLIFGLDLYFESVGREGSFSVISITTFGCVLFINSIMGLHNKVLIYILFSNFDVLRLDI